MGTVSRWDTNLPLSPCLFSPLSFTSRLRCVTFTVSHSLPLVCSPISPLVLPLMCTDPCAIMLEELQKWPSCIPVFVRRPMHLMPLEILLPPSERVLPSDLLPLCLLLSLVPLLLASVPLLTTPSLWMV